MKRLMMFVALSGVAVALSWAALRVLQIPPRSDVVIFYIVRVGIIPLPLPVGLFTMPHFWAIVIALAAMFFAVRALAILRN